MTTSTGLAISWDERQKHDALALADLVGAKELTSEQLFAQAAEAVERLDPAIEAVLGLYDDMVADPDRDAPSTAGRLYDVPTLLKDLGLGLAGRTQESGSRLFMSSKRRTRWWRTTFGPGWYRSAGRQARNAA